MKCSIYRSPTREFTYLYMQPDMPFEDLPAELRQVFGVPEKVMDLELTADRKLAQEDTATVLNNLNKQGFHLQLPPKDDPEGWLELMPSPQKDLLGEN